MTTGKVANQSTCFTGDQFASSEIPRTQTNFEITVNARSGNIGQIQRSRAGAAEVSALGKHFAEDIHVRGGVLFGFEREAGRDNRAVQVACIAAAQTVAIQLCALTAGRGEQFVTHRIVNHSDFSAAFNTYGDGNREVRQTFYEVGGAIQWIDNPLNILIGTFMFTAFFGDDGVLWVRFADRFDNNRFSGFIDVGHEIIAAFLAGFY